MFMKGKYLVLDLYLPIISLRKDLVAFCINYFLFCYS